MGEEVASIGFELSVDCSGITEQVNSACQRVRSDFERSFSQARASATKEMSAANAEISAILQDTERSAQSKAASIAAFYRKQGDSQEEAFRKAWSHIKRDSASSSEKVKKNVSGIEKAAKDSAGKSKRHFLKSFLGIRKDAEKTEKSAAGSFASLAKKAGAALVAAFAIRQLVDFGKECIDLGSDLAEVQNVVDVTFPAMTNQVDAFAKGAATCFGLSETMAKRFTGTFGAMAKAFGFSEQQAYDMSATLTGLAGDVASFYNISQDEAYTKLKSVFTGETESLKDLGVVMTQTALDAFALANGYGKTTSAMSEAEKVALRYAFVQKQLTAAAGDFSRTSDSWANQVRILNLQFESLKATIGQGLINIFAPVLRVVNILIAKLAVLAGAFKSLTAKIFGDAGGGAAASVAAVSDNAVAASDSLAGVGKSAQDAAKKIKGAFSIDELNLVSEDSSGGAGGSGGDGGVAEMDFGAALGEAEAADGQIEGFVGRIKGRLQELSEFITSTFGSSFEKVWLQLAGPIAEFRDLAAIIFEDIKSLGQPLIDYFSGPFISLLKTTFESAGTIAAGLLDTFNKVFEDLWNIAVFPFIEQLISVWLPIFTEFVEETIKSVTSLFENVKILFDALWAEGVKPALELICDIFGDFMELLRQFWEEWASPIFANFRKSLDQTKGVLLAAWEEVIQPVWEEFMAAVDDLWTNHLAPLVQNFLGLVGEFINGALEIYNRCIAPLIQWFVEMLAPMFRSVFHTILQYFSSWYGGIADIVNGIITAIRGIIQFVTGVFTGNWRKAWQGIKTIFKGIFDSLVAVVKTPINMIIDIINGMIGGVVSGVNSVIRAINSIRVDMPDWLGGGHIGFNLAEFSAPQIPKLAQGGYVKANTPRLAIIGDNKTQGEIVSPEGKLMEMARMAAQMAAGSGADPGALAAIIDLLERILSLIERLDLVVNIDIRELHKKLKDLETRSGYSF